MLALPAGLWLAAPSGEAIWAAAPELLLLAVFPTALAFIFQALALRTVAASHAALIVSLESVVGALGAVVLLGERPTLTVVGGAALLVMAITWAGWPRSGRLPA